MGCGVTGEDDVRRYFDLGADAVSLCTLALRKPHLPGQVFHANATVKKLKVVKRNIWIRRVRISPAQFPRSCDHHWPHT